MKNREFMKEKKEEKEEREKEEREKRKRKEGNFKVNYKLSLFLTILFTIIALIAIKFIDDMRYESLAQKVNDITLDSESTRLILLYPTIFEEEGNKSKLCEIMNFNVRRQLDKGFQLVNLLKTYEKANLLADYELTRKRYFLSNIETWFYTTQIKRFCNDTDTSIILFFHTSETECPDCIVQGQILDSLREKCKNLRIITLAIDLNIDVIELIKSQYNVTEAPSLILDNKIVIKKIATEDEILNYIKCKN